MKTAIKKTLLLLLVFSNTCIVSYAQIVTVLSSTDGERIYVATRKKVLDTCVLRAQYRMILVRDTKNTDDKRHHFMLLQIGNKMSKFSDYNLLTADSLGEVFARQKMSYDEAFPKLDRYLRGHTSLNVFKNYPAGKITQTERLLTAGNYKYEEEKEKPDWKIEPGSQELFGYACKKATTTFRGRNYTAWYAPEIAYSEGPWKFWGLPGLILNVSDDKEECLFECVGIEKAPENSPIYMRDISYFNTNRKTFNKQARQVFDNPRQTLENSGVVATKGGLPPNRSIPYNPIELDD